MANVIITMKIMPEGPETDLHAVEKLARAKIEAFAGPGEMRVVQQPVAFGLKALQMTFVSDEKKGSTETLEKEIMAMDGVNSVEVTDVRRAVG